MSKRRKIGDVVLVARGAGFWTGGPTVARTLSRCGPCFCGGECDDPECMEWDVERIGDGPGPEYLRHVAECQMGEVCEVTEVAGGG